MKVRTLNEIRKRGDRSSCKGSGTDRNGQVHTEF